MEQTHICYRCGTEKPLRDFIQRVDERHYNMCRQCVSAILAAQPHAKKERLHHSATHRTCYLCRRFLPIDQFVRRQNDTFFSACKECNRHVFAPRRRARIEGGGGSYTLKEWKALLTHHERCPGCGRSWQDIPPPATGASVIHADHIVPVAKGGTSNIENIQPLCYSCNSRKGDKV
jgi:5-methylcytosine-specific restriction endonuclease McrA